MTKLTNQNQRNTTTLNGDNNKSTTTSVMANGGVTKTKRTRRTVPRDSPPQRSSIYRGVTRHRWTGRFEAHLWDKNCWNESQNKKGRQVYLGAYDDEQAAAHAYDLAALKYWGRETILNFPLATYQKELKEMEGQSREEYIGSLRRKSSGFSRGVSKYRGVARHHHNGRWEARIGRVFGNKYLYLGTYATQEEAAIAYDMAAIEYRGLNAVTNFDLSRYIKWLKPNDNNNGSSSNSNNDNNISTNHIETHPANPNTKIHYSANNNNNVATLYAHNQQSSSSSHGDTLGLSELTMQPQLRPATATSALGLLLQSSKFREMMEMNTAVDSSSSNQDQDQLEQNPKFSFPEEIQTYFEGHEESNSFGGEEDILFSELNAFAPPLFQCDFD